MPFNKEQNLWLARFTGGDAGSNGLSPTELLMVARASEEVEARLQKQLHLAQLRGDVADIRDELREAFRGDVELSTGESMKMVDQDQTQAFDWWEDVGKLDMERLVSTGREQRMSEAKVKLTLIEQRLSAVRFTWSVLNSDGEVERTETKPLFDDGELADELYTPLVREQLLPETFVEDAFSRVQQMITATNDAYIAELEQVAEREEARQDTRLAKSVVTAVAKLTSDAITIDASLGDIGIEQAELLRGAVALTEASILCSIDLGVDLAGGDCRKGLSGVLTTMSTSIGAAVVQSTGSDLLGKAVTGSMMSAARVDDMVAAVASGNRAGFIGGLTEVAASGFDLSGVIPSSQDQDGDLNSIIVMCGEGAKTAFVTLVTAQQEDLFGAVSAGDWGKLRAVLVSSAAQAARIEFARNFPEEAIALERVRLKLEDAADRLAEFAEHMSNTPEAKAAAEAQRALQEAEKKNVEDRMRAEKEAFETNLELLGQREVVSEADLKSLSGLIADLKRDRALMASAVGVGSAGIAIAREFVAPLALAGTLVSFAATLAAAIDRAIAWRKWQEANQEALTASSPYLTSIQNFVKNQGEQLTHKSITAALLLLQVAAQAAATAGTGTPIHAIAAVVDKGLSMALTLNELVYTIYQRNELEKAWALTKRALDNPQNRKANLIARRQNGTLAKYSIAYGAIEAKDVVAVSAMNKIGLSRETLSQADAKVGAVKEYLELLYADDQKVLRSYSRAQPWTKDLPEPELTPRAWMMTLQIARKAGKLELPPSADVDRLITQAATNIEGCDEARARASLTQEQLDGTVAILRELRAALDAYAASQGGDFVQSVSRDYKSLVADHGGELIAWRAEAR